METLYRKVAVGERLPENKKYYATDIGMLYLDGWSNWQENEFSKKKKVPEYNDQYFEEPDWWLEEIPDNEAELRKENNGWIKIESSFDLPLKRGEYWFVSQLENGKIVKAYFNPNSKSDGNKAHYIKLYSHYQPIIKPEPPKF